MSVRTLDHKIFKFPNKRTNFRRTNCLREFLNLQQGILQHGFILEILISNLQTHFYLYISLSINCNLVNNNHCSIA